MSWERDPLWAKARLFFEHALAHDRDDPRFGLWCAFGIELLAKAAVSSISPTLLALPDPNHKHLLHALGRGDSKVGPQSLGAAQVFRLCETLFPGFTAEHTTFAIALVNRRNAELHSGQSAFDEYSTQHWIVGFYSCCKALTHALGESLEALLGESESTEAENVLAVEAREVRQRVNERVARYGGVFADRSDEDRKAVNVAAETEAERLAYLRHHKVKCPACSSAATVQGDALGSSKVADADGEIVVRQAVAPRRFACSACGLKLEGYAELAVAGLGDQYTRTTRFSPEEYYELLSPDDEAEIERIARENLGMFHPGDREYDNE
jgi:hypothetical protein